MIDGLEENIKKKKITTQNSAFVNISGSCTLPKRELKGNKDKSNNYTLPSILIQTKDQDS